MSELGYEFHVTVDANGADQEAFRATCQELAVKPIVLDLGINNNTTLTDFMTSSKAMYGSDDQAYAELQRIAEGMEANKYKVVRRKIEAVPWHPLAPQQAGESMPEGCYFEAHLGIDLLADDVARLREILATERPDLHLSRNAFKQLGSGRMVLMATLRDYRAPFDAFTSSVVDAQTVIAHAGFALEKEAIVEFALYDSNVHHDTPWMTK
jgi:hypothetical protein